MLLNPTVVDDHDDSSLGEISDDRPHEQRAVKPRPARRLNHAFKYLYRHDIPAEIQAMDPLTYLQDYAGYTQEQVISMNQTFPPLLTLSVPRQLHPKLRFLQETLQVESSSDRVQATSLVDERNQQLSMLPPQYFGARLERILAPRHAFLMHYNLTHGLELVSDANKWQAFLLAARKAKRFAALCQSWQSSKHSITSKQVEAFDALFGRGLMAAARNELVQHNNTWPLQYVDVTAARMMDLLIRHGANPKQLDFRGVSLLHWAAGTGHLEAVQVLLAWQARENERIKTSSTTNCTTSQQQTDRLDIFHTVTQRDGATVLHWAAAGAKAREFGCGGHVHVCQYLLEHVDSGRRKEYVNLLTKDGNSALMWAAWSGTLETVKLLVRHRARSDHANRNGCTVAHWAASGGNVEVCKYLFHTVGVDFTVGNHGGNTPLTHAVAFGRSEVVKWLREEVLKGSAEDDETAFNLAQDFVHWTDGDERRQQVLKLFQDWYSFDDAGDAGAEVLDEEDDDIFY